MPRFPRNWMKKLPSNRFFHEPVLLQETIEKLAVKPGRWYLDATVGGGGHALEIIRKKGRILGIDWDQEAYEAAKKRLSLTGPGASWQLVKASFADLEKIVLKAGIGRVWGVVFDLGVSSNQLEGPERGFSFQADEELDMRMDRENQTVKAKDLLIVLSEKELYELFKKFSDEQLARLIARSLVRARRVRPIVTTSQLREQVAKVYKKAGRVGGRIDPATKVFQALRIAVNDELNNLKKGLDQAFKILEREGRLAVISFHSGEDRIVKLKFRNWHQESKARILTKKPIVPTKKEIEANPRARSAKLRALEKIDND